MRDGMLWLMQAHPLMIAHRTWLGGQGAAGGSMRRNISTATALFFLLVTIVAGTTADADTAANKCGGAKLKAAGRYAQSVLYCYASATRNNAMVDSECLNKASAKLGTSFTKAQAAGGCVTTGDDGT